jgi:hypothetical protein
MRAARRPSMLRHRLEKPVYSKDLREAAATGRATFGRLPKVLRTNRLIFPSFSGASKGTDGGTVAQLRRNSNRV